MNVQSIHPRERPTGYLPEGDEIRRNIVWRRRYGVVWRAVFLLSLIIGLLALATLLYTIINDAFGYIVVQPGADPQRPKVVASYGLTESLFARERLEAIVRERFPGARLEFHAWLNLEFLLRPMNSVPILAGVGNAILGSLLIIAIAMSLVIPIGILGGVYLEEYASNKWYYRLIETNINNLAGVPSIVYGLLGLAVFVRALQPITSGAAFGINAADGRTILSAGLTMALLVLPLMIINAREAIRAVPQSIRHASYSLGATRWQTIWHHVLPNALPGILTGTILSTSRAIGETAPLIVVGAATAIESYPDSVFDRFTALPIQIFHWAGLGSNFRGTAAAAIIVLLITLLLINATAILLRNRFRRHY